MKKQKGFTLIELMIVVAIIGILAAVAIPKFASMLEKAREGATKGNIGAIKSAISIYYGDNQGQWPTILTDTYFLKYMDKIPAVKAIGTNTVKLSGTDNAISYTNEATDAAIGSAATNDGWKFNYNTGNVWVNSSLPDTNGTAYSQYGYQ
jgi:prepilin-type N-terminal cleavage/methylation domain-containing protein